MKTMFGFFYTLFFRCYFCTLMDDGAFQDSVLGSIGKMEKKIENSSSKQEELLKNYDQLGKDTKSAMEELTQLKNAANDQAGVLTALRKVQLQLQREQRMAFGDPVQRILADPEKRARINAEVRRLCHMPLSAEQLKALDLGTTPGSTYLTSELSTEIYDVLASYGKWNSLAVRTVGKSTVGYPVKTARPIASFFRKAASGKLNEDTAKAGAKITLSIESIGVLLSVDEELLQDSEIDIAADVLGDAGEALNYRMDHAAFAAAGANDDADGAFTGIFCGGTPAAAAATHTTHAKLTLDDWMLPLTKVASGVLTRKCKWWMHPQNLVRALGVKDTNGRPIFLTASEAPSAGGIGSILGYAVELVDVAPNASAAGSKVAAFGDPNGQVVAVRKTMEFAESSDFQFNAYSRAFRAVGRFATGTRKADAFGILTLAAE